MKHNVYQVGADHDFVVFNDGELSMEPLVAGDVEKAAAKDSAFIHELRNAAWSCNINWYFIVYDDGIVLLNTYSGKGLHCRKKSAMFIQMFLDAPLRRQHGHQRR